MTPKTDDKSRYRWSAKPYDCLDGSCIVDGDGGLVALYIPKHQASEIARRHNGTVRYLTDISKRQENRSFGDRATIEDFLSTFDKALEDIHDYYEWLSLKCQEEDISTTMDNGESILDRMMNSINEINYTLAKYYGEIE